MEPSIFTKIINGEIPCHKIYEDEHTFAFLDIYPITPGHTLVIPKKEIEFVWDLDDDTYQAVFKTAKMIAARQKEVLQVPFVGSQIIGVDVPHAHVHLIPFTEVSEYRRVVDMSGEPDHESLAQMAEKLRLV